MTDPKAKPFLDLLAPLQNHPMWEHMHCSVHYDEVMFFAVYGGCTLEIDFDLEDDYDIYICTNEPPYPQFQGDPNHGEIIPVFTDDINLVLKLARKQLDKMLDIKNRTK